jgi:NAD-dependent DNA ligase
MVDGIAGWSSESLGELMKAMPEALAWIDQSFPGFAAEAAQAVSVAPAAPAVPLVNKYVVFTNVRDKELEKKLAPLGWLIEDSITKKTQVLVVPDGPLKESTKVKKAKDSGGRIEIVAISEFRSRF